MPVGRWIYSRPLRIDLAIRNTGSAAATLPKPDKWFGYLVLAQGKTAYYTERIFPARQWADWPDALAPGRTLRLPPLDVRKLKVFSHKRGLRIVDGYPTELLAGKPIQPQPIGSAGEVLLPGPVRIKHRTYLPRENEGALFLVGSVLKLEIRISDFARLPPAEKQRALGDLASRMKRDAFSAKVAHADAVRIGPPAIPTLARVLQDEGARFFARMWAATALADVGGKGVVDTLTACLTDRTPGVRHAAAYHGLKVGDPGFDKAALARALSGEDPMVTAWTIMGYLKFRKQVPRKLLEAAVTSKDWKVRDALVAPVARGAPDASHAPILRRLVLDTNERIRRQAAAVLGRIKDRSRETIDSLIEALDLKGESARHAVAAALCRLTGKDWPYSLSSPIRARKAVVVKWESWWAENSSGYPASGSGK